MQSKYSRAVFATGITLLMLSAAANVLAGDDVNQHQAAESHGTVSIKNIRGEIELYGWDKNEISVEGELDDLTKEFIFEVDGGQTHIEVRIPRHNANWGDGSDLKIRVPSGSRVSFSGVSTDTRFKDIMGGLKVDSVSGDIEIENVAEALIIKSVSGDIEVKEATGDIRVSTVSGEMDLDLSSNNLSLESISGDIKAKFSAFTRLRASTVSGSQHYKGSLSDNGDIDISSVSGDITLGLQETVNSRISVKTGAGGDIRNKLSDDEAQNKFPASKSLVTTFGSGSGNIFISTVSADVRLESH